MKFYWLSILDENVPDYNKLERKSLERMLSGTQPEYDLAVNIIKNLLKKQHSKNKRYVKNKRYEWYGQHRKGLE